MHKFIISVNHTIYSILNSELFTLQFIMASSLVKTNINAGHNSINYLCQPSHLSDEETDIERPYMSWLRAWSKTMATGKCPQVLECHVATPQGEVRM